MKSISSLFATAASLLLATSVGAQVSTASRWTAVAGIRTWERGRLARIRCEAAKRRGGPC